jgi:hypothetical protein
LQWLESDVYAVYWDHHYALAAWVGLAIMIWATGRYLQERLDENKRKQDQKPKAPDGDRED